MPLPFRIALIIALILIAGAGATPASAGFYQVYSCHPDHGNVNNSWQSLSNKRGILVYVACNGHRASLGPWDRGLVTRAMVNRKDKRATIPRGAAARWKFTAPPGASLAKRQLHRLVLRQVRPDGNTPSRSLPDGLVVRPQGRWPLLDDPQTVFDAALLKTTASLRTYCTGGRCAVGGGTPRAWATMRSIAVQVYDTTLPSISVIGGSGITPGWKRGDVDVTGRRERQRGHRGHQHRRRRH